MGRTRIHYEAAFEDYLRAKGHPYVCVDDAKRSMLGAASLKSFDFVVYSTDGPNLLVDIKGRKFPDSVAGKRKASGRAWENWITRQDVDGLSDWEGVFGTGFRSMLVFAYWLQGPAQRAPFEDVHLYRENLYAFMAISLDQYVTLAKPRSQRWQTISVPAKEFAATARDLSTYL